MDSNSSLWDAYSIPVALSFLLITTGGFVGNNGLGGDFGLDYCNDKDRVLAYSEEFGYKGTERVVVHSKSYFACELGYINGIVDLGWAVSSFTYGQVLGSGRAMILNHENYKNFQNNLQENNI